MSVLSHNKVSEEMIFNVLEASFLHCLEDAITAYPYRICYGCDINHPSQTHHPCVMDDILYDHSMWQSIVDCIDRDVVHRIFDRILAILKVKETAEFEFGRMYPFVLGLWKGEKGGISHVKENALLPNTIFTLETRQELIREARTKYGSDIVREAVRSHAIEKKNNAFRYRLRLIVLKALVGAWHGISYEEAKLTLNELQILQRFKAELSEEDKPFFGYFRDHLEFSEIFEDLPTNGASRDHLNNLVLRDDRISFLLRKAEMDMNVKLPLTIEAYGASLIWL
ncbi:uncharacterized protein [Apostichopus japonicus]|uniref:uncharacterized protein n=1 Tax=Stichopus japonicus TaxID=307972 RepID=UPI003AB19B80